MKLNVETIKLRLRKLEQYIGELEKHQTAPLEAFQRDFTAQLAAERAFQAAVESCADIASHVVSVYDLGQPQAQRDMFLLLARAGYLKHDFADTMGQLVGLRNRLVHLYWDVDIERLYEYLHEDTDYLRQFRDFVLRLVRAEEEAPSEKDEEFKE